MSSKPKTFNMWLWEHPGDQQPRYGEGRVCSHPDCGTILDPYNEMNVCWLHRHSWKPARTKRRPARL